MSSLNTAISGLRSHQLLLDVIADNLANANTPGFKKSRALFTDILYRTMAGATTPGGGRGGTDPMQIGLGVTIGAISPIFTQGSLQRTDRPTDLAVQGEGFFVLKDGPSTSYTRVGAFTFDANGTLVDSATGLKVQGLDGDIVISPGLSSAPQATTQAAFGGNLDVSAAEGTPYPATFTIYDSLGGKHTLKLTFTRTANPGELTYTVQGDDTMTIAAGTTGTLIFKDDGTLDLEASEIPDLSLTAFVDGASDQVIKLDLSPVTGFASPSTLALKSQDGFPAGTLEAFFIGPDGTITGTFSNGKTEILGTLQLATFTNPGGLLKVGDNLYRESPNSGAPNVGAPGTGGRGMLTPGTLEGSNVDLAEEFTRLIVAQRGFQANARVITTSDQILEEAVNLKR